MVLESDLVEVSAGGRTFTLPIPGYGATFGGRFVQEGDTVKLYDGMVTVGSSTTTIATKTLSPL